MLIKVGLCALQRDKWIFIAFAGLFSEVEQTAESENPEMNQSIVENSSSGLVHIENLPFVCHLFIAESPSENVLNSKYSYKEKADEERVDSEEEQTNFFLTRSHIILCGTLSLNCYSNHKISTINVQIPPFSLKLL